MAADLLEEGRLASIPSLRHMVGNPRRHHPRDARHWQPPPLSRRSPAFDLLTPESDGIKYGVPGIPIEPPPLSLAEEHGSQYPGIALVGASMAPKPWVAGVTI